ALGGAIAAVVGLVAGVGLSRLLLTFVSPFSTPTAPRYEVVVLTPSTIAIVTILAVIFMAITSVRSARRTARVPIVETLRYYAPGETRIQYRPWIDIVLVTLAIVTYGMFILVTFSSQLAYQERQVRASIGADISVDSPPLDSGFSANLTALPEVAGATRVLSVRASPSYCCAGVYALDPATFFAVTNPEPWYFRAIGPDAARQILATPGQVLVTETYLQNAFLAVGDRIPLQSPVYNGTSYSTVTVNTTIGGTVRGLPGTGSYGFGLPNAIYGSADTFGPLLGSDQSLPPQFPRYGERYLVALHAGVDWRTAKADITALGASSVSVAAEQIEQR